MTVTIESALAAVHASTGRLREAVGDLVLTAVEDQPRGTDAHLITIVHDAALDLAAEAEQAAAALHATAVVPVAVAHCHARVNALGDVLVRDLAPPERLTELAGFGAEHGREAAAWATEIVRGIQTCQHLLWTDIAPALLAYWQELADKFSRTCVPSEER
jgi:hypothetical protein